MSMTLSQWNAIALDPTNAPIHRIGDLINDNADAFLPAMAFLRSARPNPESVQEALDKIPAHLHGPLALWLAQRQTVQFETARIAVDLIGQAAVVEHAGATIAATIGRRFLLW